MGWASKLKRARGEDRVRVLHHKLPPEIAIKLENRRDWLVRELPSIDGAIGLQYPLIEVSPYWTFERLGNGDITGIHGTVGPRRHGDSNVFAVTISAPTLLEFEQDLIKGLLAHEFLHVVDTTIQYYKAFEAGQTEIREAVDPDAYAASFDEYRRIDQSLQADPRKWLSDELSRLADRVDDENDHGMCLARQAIISNWIDRGLPIVEHVPVTECHGILLSRAIIQKAQSLSASVDSSGISAPAPLVQKIGPA